MRIQTTKADGSGVITEITAQTTSGPVDYDVDITIEYGDVMEFYDGYVLVIRDGKEVSRHELDDAAETSS